MTLRSGIVPSQGKAARLVAVATVFAAAVTLSGCAVGSKSLGASTSCKDFMNSSQSAQDQAVSKVATQLNAPDAVTPLGRPNINYLCAGNPTWTLGEAVQHTG